LLRSLSEVGEGPARVLLSGFTSIENSGPASPAGPEFSDS